MKIDFSGARQTPEEQEVQFGNFRLKKNIAITLVALGGVALILLFVFCVHFYGPWQTSDASCVADGYMYRVCSLCGKKQEKGNSDAAGHDFGEWSVTTEPTPSSVGVRTRVCNRCKVAETEMVDSTTQLPQIYLDGHGTFDESVSTSMSLRYKNGEDQYTLPIDISLDPLSVRASNGKYTYRIGFDKSTTFGGILGAETDAYLLIGGDLDETGSRHAVASQIAESVTGSANDLMIGLPVVLFVNGNYEGVYSLALPFTLDQLNRSSGASHKAVVIFGTANEASRFNTDMNHSDLSYLLCEDVNSDWVYSSFNAMSSAIRKTQTDGGFVKTVSDYVDTDRTIDYMILSELLGVDDTDGQYVAWATDDGTHWYPILSYLSASLGRLRSGAELDATAGMVRYSSNRVTYETASPTENQLFRGMCYSYSRVIRTRYESLRSTVLLFDNLSRRVTSCIGKAEEDLWAAETETYGFANSGADFYNRTVAWLSARLAALDKVF